MLQALAHPSVRSRQSEWRGPDAETLQRDGAPLLWWPCTLSSPLRTATEWVLKGLLDICHTKQAPKDVLYTAKETLWMGFG